MTQTQTSDNAQTQESRPVGNVINSERPPCDIVLFNSANKFAEAMLQGIPELQGVAIVPLFGPKLQNVPNGLLRLRNENSPYIASLLQMLVAVASFSADIQRDLMVQFRAFDSMAQDLAATVKHRLAELEALNAQLTEKAGQEQQQEVQS